MHHSWNKKSYKLKPIQLHMKADISNKHISSFNLTELSCQTPGDDPGLNMADCCNWKQFDTRVTGSECRSGDSEGRMRMEGICWLNKGSK